MLVFLTSKHCRRDVKCKQAIWAESPSMVGIVKNMCGIENLNVKKNV